MTIIIGDDFEGITQLRQFLQQLFQILTNFIKDIV